MWMMLLHLNLNADDAAAAAADDDDDDDPHLNFCICKKQIFS